jgi:spermidine synthase
MNAEIMNLSKNQFVRWAVVLFFFLSGFCGLLYQIVWMRLAFASFGVVTPVLSAVISIFMAGLALGSWVGGKWAARWSQASSLVPIGLYALAEGLIGLGALAVPRLFSWGADKLLPLGSADSSSYLLLSALVLAFSLLPFCFCMGLTFPLMLAFLRKVLPSETSFSFLYTANVLGAMSGTFLTAVALIECLGFRGTLLAAAILNGLLCLGALGLGLLTRPSKESPARPAPAPPSAASPRKETSLLPVLFTTGFVSMAMEVVWTRDFTFVLMTLVYSFALLLFVYLLSTFAGSWFYRRTRAQKAFPLSFLLGTAFLLSLIPPVFDDPRIHSSILGVLFSIAPFCFLLGYLTPMLVDRFSSGDPEKAGRAYAVNVLGCILGPLFASYFFLPYVSSRLSLVLLSLPLLVFVVPKPFQLPQGALRLSLAVLGVVLTAVGLLGSADYEEGFGLFYPDHLIHRDYAATVVSCTRGRIKNLFVNGVGMTYLVPATKIMAHLPLAFVPHPPQSALDICFGMGTTFRSLISWNIQTTVVELVPSVFKAFDYYWNDADLIRSNPRAHMITDDGRRFLKRTGQSFDVITVDPPPPLEAAASSLLYSVEFYDLVKKHLNQGGVFQQWIPKGELGTWQAASRSLQVSFPYVRVFPSPDGIGCHFIASLSPLVELTARQLAEKMPPSARDDLAEFFPSIPPQRVFQVLLSKEIPLSSLANPLIPSMITDDRPYNEYFLLRRRNLWLPGLF